MVAIAEGLLGAGRVLLLVFFAVLLASALQPVVDGLRRTSLPIGRPAAILLVYGTVLAAVVASGLVLVPLVVNQAGDLLSQLPTVFDRGQAWSRTLAPPELATSVGALLDAARTAVSGGANPSTGQVLSAGVGAAELIVAVISILALAFFWMTERQQLQRFVLSFMPPERHRGLREGWNTVELRLGGWVRGQLILMIALGVMTGLAYTVMGLPSGPILGIVAGLAEIVPLVGPALGVLPALVMAAAFRPDLLLAIIVIYAVIHLLESNLLVPLVMRNSVGVSPFLLTVSLLIGAALGGVMGAAVSIPLVAAVEAILERLQDRDMPVAQDASGAASQGAGEH